MARGDTRLNELFGDVLNVICTGRIRRGEAKRVGGVRVDVNCTLFVHVVSKGKDKESNVGGPAPFVDVESSDV